MIAIIATSFNCQLHKLTTVPNIYKVSMQPRVRRVGLKDMDLIQFIIACAERYGLNICVNCVIILDSSNIRHYNRYFLCLGCLVYSISQLIYRSIFEKYSFFMVLLFSKAVSQYEILQLRVKTMRK